MGENLRILFLGERSKKTFRLSKILLDKAYEVNILLQKEVTLWRMTGRE